MEVAPPVNPTDFNFNPSYTTTPKLNMGSAPTSPTRSISQLYHNFDHLLISDDTTTPQRNSPATVPFAWEEKPGVPKQTTTSHDTEFAFDVSGELFPASSATADDLFHHGVIKSADVDHVDPSRATMQVNNLERERGRERKYYSCDHLPSSRSRRTRSLPPFRGQEPASAPANTASLPGSSTCTALSASGSGKGSKKWSFKDLFLFRSASDGRALDRDPLKKYSGIFRKHDEDIRNLSLRDRSGSGSRSKRRGRVSAHELHYTVNRAVSNDMKKKTFLPYKQGILGRLAFNPTVHALSNGFGFSHNN